MSDNTDPATFGRFAKTPGSDWNGGPAQRPCEQTQNRHRRSSPRASAATAQPAVPGRAGPDPRSAARPGAAPDPAGPGAGRQGLGSRANRAYLRRRKIGCTVPEKADQVRHRKACCTATRK